MKSIVIEHRRDKTEWWIVINDAVEVRCLDFDHAMQLIDDIINKEVEA